RKHPAFPAQWVLTVSSALSPVIGLVCHRRRRFLANLTPASRRQDHTTSPSASGALVRSAISVHRIPPHVRDDRETPLDWDGMAKVYCCFYRTKKRKIFREGARQ